MAFQADTFQNNAFQVVAGETHYGAAILSGIGTLAGIGRGLFIAKATLAGAGSLAGIGRLVAIGKATLAGVGTLSGIGRFIAVGKATLSGTGTLAVIGAIGVFKLGAAILSGIGSLIVRAWLGKPRYSAPSDVYDTGTEVPKTGRYGGS